MRVAEVKTAIRNKCRELGAPEAVLLSMAQVESNFNATAGKPGATFRGVLQLASGYGGCNGNERLDVGKSVACVWKHMQDDRKNFANNNIPWEDWYYYGVHQQGLAGFKQILQHKNSKLSELAKVSAARVSNIRGNMPGTKAERDRLVYVSEWINYWRNRINGLIAEYTAKDSGGGTGNGGGDGTDKKDAQQPGQQIIIGPIEVFGKKIEVERNDLLIGAGIVVVAGLALCYYRGKRGGLSDEAEAKSSNNYTKVGSINAELAKKINRPAGDIYIGKDVVAHIRKNHSNKIHLYKNAAIIDYVKKILSNVNEVREGKDSALILVNRKENTADLVIVEECILEFIDGVYRVKTAYNSKLHSLKSKKLLMSGKKH